MSATPPRLTPRQSRFVAEYMIDLKASAAAVRAGYSPKSPAMGSKLLAMPHIDEAIRLKQLEIARLTGVSVQHVVWGLLNEAHYRGEGAKHAARVAAWEAIGKHLGMFVEKTEDVTKRPRDERLARAAELLERVGVGRPRFDSGDGEVGPGEGQSSEVRRIH